MTVSIDEIVIGDTPEAWREAGFTVDDDGLCAVGAVRLRLVGRAQGSGILGWSLRGVDADCRVDGIPTTASSAPPCEPAAHPNGTTHLDHVVLLSPNLPRTIAALEAIGLEVRRVRDFAVGGIAMQQVFFRLGAVILELVGRTGELDDGPATFFGLTPTVADLDATAVLLGDRLGRIKDAVQPGRRIATLSGREFGVSVATAFISAKP